MAGYREHISVSGILGVGYGAGATFALGFTPVQGALAGLLTWVAGMLPDLDSQSGKPVREIFSLVAAVAPFVMMRHMQEWAGDPETALLFAVLLYAGIRYGAASVLGRISVHRGMFHSIPALLIAAELTFLGYKSDSNAVKLLMGGGVAVGFLSHLILDELYSVEWTGIRLRLNQAAGSAIKLVGRKFVPNVVTYALLLVVTYATLVSIGVVQEPRGLNGAPALRQAQDDMTERQ